MKINETITPPIIARTIFLTSFSALSLSTVAPAQAALMTFESLAFNNASYNTLILPSYTENGFTVAFSSSFIGIYGTQHPIYSGAAGTTAVPEPFTIIGTLVGGPAAVRMRKKLKFPNK